MTTQMQLYHLFQFQFQNFLLLHLFHQLICHLLNFLSFHPFHLMFQNLLVAHNVFHDLLGNG